MLKCFFGKCVNLISFFFCFRSIFCRFVWINFSLILYLGFYFLCFFAGILIVKTCVRLISSSTILSFFFFFFCFFGLVLFRMISLCIICCFLPSFIYLLASSEPKPLTAPVHTQQSQIVNLSEHSPRYPIYTTIAGWFRVCALKFRIRWIFQWFG